MEKTEEIQEESEKEVCLKCGTAIDEGQLFCPKCGTKKGEINNKTCEKCGVILHPNEKFCSKCGEKVKFNLQSDLQIKPDKNFVKKHKKQLIIVALIAIVIAGIVTFCNTVLPRLLITPTELILEGNYVDAYKKADDDEKEDILNENLIGWISNDISESLKDPSSYVLREAWFDEENLRIVIYCSGNNSYGALVSSYWYYTFDEDENEFELYVNVSSLSSETVYSWDDTSETIEKYLTNAARLIIKEIIAQDDLEISEDSVDNINTLFEKDLLGDIELLDENKNFSKSGTI